MKVILVLDTLLVWGAAIAWSKRTPVDLMVKVALLGLALASSVQVLNLFGYVVRS